MTDRQLINAILNRAEFAGRPFKLSDPQFGFRFMCGKLMPGIVFSNSPSNFFLLRFTKGNSRCVFIILPDPSYDRSEWFNTLVKNGEFTEYDDNAVPEKVKHNISYSIIEALKSKDIGLDAYCFTHELDLIASNETYEQISIEADLFASPIEI